MCTRERAGFEIRIMRARPQCTCSCKAYEANDVPMGVPDDDCWCANPEHPGYQDHYAGKCGCDCEDCKNCDCDCVLLVRLDRIGDDQENPVWKADHRVRRFIRPMLMRDPQVQIEEDARREQTRQLQLRSERGAAQDEAEHPEAPAAAPEQAPTHPGTRSRRKPLPKRS